MLENISRNRVAWSPFPHGEDAQKTPHNEFKSSHLYIECAKVKEYLTRSSGIDATRPRCTFSKVISLLFWVSEISCRADFSENLTKLSGVVATWPLCTFSAVTVGFVLSVQNSLYSWFLRKFHEIEWHRRHPTTVHILSSHLCFYIECVKLPIKLIFEEISRHRVALSPFDHGEQAQKSLHFYFEYVKLSVELTLEKISRNRAVSSLLDHGERAQKSPHYYMNMYLY